MANGIVVNYVQEDQQYKAIVYKIPPKKHCPISCSIVVKNHHVEDISRDIQRSRERGKDSLDALGENPQHVNMCSYSLYPSQLTR